MITSKFFHPVQIADKTWQIAGTAKENCYLLEGKASALLIDTTTGAGNLRSFCRELTDLPLHVAMTHGHADHTGGAFDFDEIFIHPEDLRFMYADTTVKHRKEHIDNRNGGSSFVRPWDLSPPRPLITWPIYDGSAFDLGDRLIDAVGVPGHSRGSMVFIDHASRIAFLGDAVNSNTLLYLDDSTGIPAYQAGLLHFKERLEALAARGMAVETFWSGHGSRALPLSLVDEALELCRRILAGTDDAEEVPGGKAPVYYARRRNTCTEFNANIAYYKNWIQEAPIPRLPPQVN